MRKLAGTLAAIAMILAVLTPVLAQACTLNEGTPDQECLGFAYDRGGVIVCKSDATGQAGICDSERRCVTCTPANGCTETYLYGFVGCTETGSAEIAAPVPAEPSDVAPSAASIPSVPSTGFAVTGEILTPGYLPGFELLAAASAAVLGSGVALVLRSNKSAKLRRRHLRSLEQEKKDLKSAKFDYGKVGIIFIMMGIGSIVVGASRFSYTGNLTEVLTAISWRWVVLALFALAIIYYAWLCREDVRKRRR